MLVWLMCYYEQAQEVDIAGDTAEAEKKDRMALIFNIFSYFITLIYGLVMLPLIAFVIIYIYIKPIMLF